MHGLLFSHVQPGCGREKPHGACTGLDRTILEWLLTHLVGSGKYLLTKGATQGELRPVCSQVMLAQLRPAMLCFARCGSCTLMALSACYGASLY